MTSARHLAHDWYPSAIPDNVEIGAGTYLYSSFAFLHCRSRRDQAVQVGRSCGVYNGCFFDLGPDGHIRIGDFTTLVGVIFATNGSVRIGSYCFLAHEVVIADSQMATPPSSRNLGDRALDEPSNAVVLGNDVWVGANAVLLRGTRIGDGAVVGAGTVLDCEVPAYSIVAGNPPRIIGKVPLRASRS